MQKLPRKLKDNLEARRQNGSIRKLGIENGLVDFSSNDYLGFSTSLSIFERSHEILKSNELLKNGSGGSRLLSGNNSFYELAEEKLADFHHAPAALIFNSGYDANLGIFGSLAQRGDVILYDEYVHASIRDGLRLSSARAYKFKHNDLEDLDQKLERLKSRFSGEVYIVTETIFSMDGDGPDLKKLADVSNKHNAYLILDEAHSTGVFMDGKKGLVETAGITDSVFARVLTFGKALGVHGAVVLGDPELKTFLINFSRSFIYTTALPAHSLAAILAAYEHLAGEGMENSGILRERITFFVATLQDLGLQDSFIKSESAIHCCLIPGNEEVRQISERLASGGFDVKAILSPTVPKGEERLRFCLHSFNSSEEIKSVLSLLSEEIMKLKKP